MGLSRRLRQVRKAAGLSESQLALSIQWSSSAVRLIESGERIPTIDTIERLAAVLQVSPCWLAFGAEGPLLFRQKRPRTPAASDGTEAADPDEAAETGETGQAEVPVAAAGGPCGSSGESHREVGQRLQAQRDRLGLSARALALSAGVSVQQILNTEAGLTVPKVDNVERLAVALDVPPCWLAYGTPSAEPSPSPSASDD